MSRKDINYCIDLTNAEIAILEELKETLNDDLKRECMYHNHYIIVKKPRWCNTLLDEYPDSMSPVFRMENIQKAQDYMNKNYPVEAKK